jgi:hypothetical protein
LAWNNRRPSSPPFHAAPHLHAPNHDHLTSPSSPNKPHQTKPNLTKYTNNKQNQCTDYLGVSQDICDMKKMLNTKQPPYKEALAIYMDGKNAKRPDGSLMSLRQLGERRAGAAGTAGRVGPADGPVCFVLFFRPHNLKLGTQSQPHPPTPNPPHAATSGRNQGLPFWDLYSKHFGNPVWIDDTMQRAFAGIAPFTTPVQRVQLIVKTLESNLQVAVVMSRLDQAIAFSK